eukprot:2894191-Ditylum_brightwellii.AAC.1
MQELERRAISGGETAAPVPARRAKSCTPGSTAASLVLGARAQVLRAEPVAPCACFVSAPPQTREQFPKHA